MTLYSETSGSVELNYDGNSDMVRCFLRQVKLIGEAIDNACGNWGIDADAYQNHMLDALEMLIGRPDQTFDEAQQSSSVVHVLTLPCEEFIKLFGRMTLVRAFVNEFHGVDDDYPWYGPDVIEAYKTGGWRPREE